MAEEEKKDAESDALDDLEGGGRKGKKKLLIIVILLVLIGAGAGGAYFMGLIGGGDHDSEMTEDGEHGDEDGHGTEVVVDDDAMPIFFELQPFVVNLNSGGKRASFIKATITLELPNEEVAKRVDALQPRIEDSFNTYLRELRPSDLNGSAGIYRLREELLLRINKAIKPEKVNDILFKEIVVQ